MYLHEAYLMHFTYRCWNYKLLCINTLRTTGGEGGGGRGQQYEINTFRSAITTPLNGGIPLQGSLLKIMTF
jgi:hypothetical protein